MHRRLALFALIPLFTSAASARAQEAAQPALAASPTVTVSVTSAGVRFVALGPVRQTRLEVYDSAGSPLFDSGFLPGNIRDWTAQGRGLSDGVYTCVLTARDLSGRLSIKQGAVVLVGGQVTLPLGDAEGAGVLNREQAAPASPVTAETGAATLSTHDGRDGAVTSISGDLTFRTGDVLSGAEREHVRVTSDGRVGVGTTRPEATLDVAGAVRARGGFKFPDGSTLTSKAGRLTLTSAEGEEIPGPNAAGTGTLNKIAKWSETGGAGTLTDSTFEEDASGNVFNFTGTRTVVPGQQPFFEAQRSSPGDIMQRFWNTGSGGAKLRYVAGTGATSQIQLTDGLEWLSAIAGNNAIGLQFRVRGTGTTNSEAQLDTSARLTIARNGNVGVGIALPTAPLHVVGNGLFTGNLTAGAVNFTGLRTFDNATSPNIIGGHSGNIITDGVTGGTIGGGGDTILGLNRVTDYFGTVGGGAGNRAGNNAGTTSDTMHATVGGGRDNTASGTNSTVAGGSSNAASGFASTAGGGSGNAASSTNSTVGGGGSNTASGANSTVGGGKDNTASGFASTVPGGSSSAAQGDYSFAAGRRAKALNQGSFVWADSTNADFSSTANDQFLIRAAGGVGINTNATSAAALNVAGNTKITGNLEVTGTITGTLPSGSGNYIQNTLSTQAASNFNISGSGTAGGTLSANVVNSATQYNLGGERVLLARAPVASGLTSVGILAGGVGEDSAFFGVAAGQNNTGFNNSFFGSQTGNVNTSGFGNSFFGAEAGRNNSQGFANSFFGQEAGLWNTLGGNNSFFGVSAGLNNTEGSYNSFFGVGAGHQSDTGNDNAFFGNEAGGDNHAGDQNAFFGRSAGFNNISGSGNTAVGSHANTGSSNLTNATAVGHKAFVTQNNSLVLGSILGVNDCAANSTPVCGSVRVGIGVTAPGNLLHVRGDGTAPGGLATPEVVGHFEQPSASQHAAISVNAASGRDSILYFAESGTAVWGLRHDADDADKFQLRYHGGGVGDNTSARLTVQSNGNVGLGTNAPARKLHIGDAMRLQPIASPPASPASGDLYFDTSEALCVYVGGAWAKLAGPGTCQ